MKTTFLFNLCAFFVLGTVISPSLTKSQDAPASGNSNSAISVKQEKAESDALRDRFNKLSDAEKKQYAQLWMQLQAYMQNSNSLEAIQIADKLDEMIPGNPAVYNVKGAAYLKLKNVPKAQEYFTKACDLSPNNGSFLFNLAETFFVSHDYQKAADQFLSLLAKMEKEKNANTMTKSLVQFKTFLCYIKLGNREKADEFARLYTADDDTPYYYCTKGVLEWEAGNKEAAQKTFLAAMNIYGSDGMYLPFGDSLTETGFMPSIEGPTVPIAPKK